MAAVSLQPIDWMMALLKPATLQRVFSYLTNGRSWPFAAIGIAENYAYRIAALRAEAEVQT